MLSQDQPIELTHTGILLDKTGRKWAPGKYPANSVPYELTEDVRGKNFVATDKQEYSKVPTLNEEKEPELKLEVKPVSEEKPVAKVAVTPATTLASPAA